MDEINNRLTSGIDEALKTDKTIYQDTQPQVVKSSSSAEHANQLPETFSSKLANFQKTLNDLENKDAKKNKRFSHFRRVMSGLRKSKKDEPVQMTDNIIGDSTQQNDPQHDQGVPHNSKSISRIWFSLFGAKENGNLSTVDNNLSKENKSKTIGRIFKMKNTKVPTADESVNRPRSCTLGRRGVQDLNVMETSSEVTIDSD